MKNKKIIILSICLILLVVLIFVIYYFTRPSDIAIKKETIKHDVVDELYDNIEASECTTIGNVNNEKDAVIYMAFSSLKKDKLLSDKIAINDFNKALKSVAGDDSYTFDTYVYGGYKYSLSDNYIIREKTTNCNERYVSKLFGYSYNEGTLLVDVKFGYVSDSKVYDLNKKEIGTYSKDSLNSVLDKGTSKTFIYQKENNSYYLNGVK